MFKKILIANRGEIARRIQRTAHKLGVRTVGVYSEADALALHVQECDEAVFLGEPEAAQSYLNIPKVIEAALATGAQAIHPGYGFLSENADFAQACADAGLVFIGPSVHAIRVMGSKSEAKACVQAAGVPLIPGYFGADQSLATLQTEAERIGYPLMIKAVAGGGGKGIRAVAQAADLPAALEACQREARNAFGDPTVMLEKQIVQPRHVEVQVFGDTHGNVVHLFERDCSAQRRHQKVIEEAPAFGLSEQTRSELGQTAVAVAKAVNYVGAGTVEFLLDASGQFYFMEMNTRLQVEHPVTEMVTGFDLVEWQLRVAAGEALPADQTHIHLNGHAFEARLYAENPEQGFLPAIGQVALWEGPEVRYTDVREFEVGVLDAQEPQLRMDGAMRSGLSISPYYDPMVGKLITWAPTRAEALQALAQALGDLRCVGVKNNVAWLRTLALHPEFVQGGYDTGLIDREMQAMLNSTAADVAEADWAALAGMARWALHASTAVGQGKAAEQSLQQDPLARLDGFAAATAPLRVDQWTHRKQAWATATHVHIAQGMAHVHGRVGPLGKAQAVDALFDLNPGVAWDEQGLVRCQGVVESGAHAGTEFDVVWLGNSCTLHWGSASRTLEWHNPALIRSDQADAGHGVRAPMPGKVFAVHVKAGDSVTKGQALIGLEAMKMEHMLTAPADGVVASVPYAVGQQVQEGMELVLFKE